MARPPRYPTHREPDSPPPLPFVPGEVSNGEFVPSGATARDRAIVAGTLRRVADAADRLGVDRRRFLQSTGGMAAMLATVNLVGCADPDPVSAPTRSPTATGATNTAGSGPSATPGGTYDVPSPEDVAACAGTLESQGELIIDVHTHHVMPDGPWRRTEPAIASMIRDVVPANCTEADPLVCVDRRHYLSDIFLASDTGITVLSDVPSSGGPDSPIPFADQVGTYEFANELTDGGTPRVLVQAIVAPNFYDPGRLFEEMARQQATGAVATFKTYTAWGPAGPGGVRAGYALDDPVVGLPWLERAQALGVRVICAHKGLPIQGFDQRFNGPRDVVAAAVAFPDLQFVVFHSAFERATTEGPYDPARAERGTNSLLKALDDAGLPPNSNVWCELGTTWREVMTNPTQAAHVVGKLLRRVGEDRVLWGTDAVWYGSPQPQIMAFRAFQITELFQQQFGYPALTPDRKAKVFGRNAARLFGLDIEAVRCAIDGSKLGQARVAFRDLHAHGEIAEPWRARAPLTRREVLTWLRTDRRATLNPF